MGGGIKLLHVWHSRSSKPAPALPALLWVDSAPALPTLCAVMVAVVSEVPHRLPNLRLFAMPMWTAQIVQ